MAYVVCKLAYCTEYFIGSKRWAAQSGIFYISLTALSHGILRGMSDGSLKLGVLTLSRRLHQGGKAGRISRRSRGGDDGRTYRLAQFYISNPNTAGA